MESKQTAMFQIAQHSPIRDPRFVTGTAALADRVGVTSTRAPADDVDATSAAIAEVDTLDSGDGGTRKSSRLPSSMISNNAPPPAFFSGFRRC
jgi:hypothetical protein